MEIRVMKAERRLYVYESGALRWQVPIQLGFGADDGAKSREGDGRTPEGIYYVCSKNPVSKYHLALGISYPNMRDAETALSEGRITREQYAAICQAEDGHMRPPWDTPLGGWIMLHGQPKDSERSGDWTAGCIAVQNADMDRLFAALQWGDAVRIFP